MPDALISAPLASALERGRERFNALVGERVASGQRFDAAALADHLRESVNPVVDAVYRVDPGSVGPVTDVLFRLTLDLIGRDLAGPGTRYPEIAEGWRKIFPEVASLLARAPQQVAGSLTNAIYRVSVTSSGAALSWIDTMVALARHCRNVTELLDAGKVAAWRAGLAHYRRGALDACRSLPPDVAALALGVGRPVTSHHAMLDRLENDPWLDPAIAACERMPEPSLRVVATVGAFRGFGGPFRVPPKVYVRDGQLVAKDDEGAWVLTADRFGSTWHRSSGEDLLAQTFPDAAVARDGSARIGSVHGMFPGLGQPWTQAFDGTTLAVTLALSHRVTLLASTP